MPMFNVHLPAACSVGLSSKLVASVRLILREAPTPAHAAVLQNRTACTQQHLHGMSPASMLGVH
jgi:hypothetical protein